MCVRVSLWAWQLKAAARNWSESTFSSVEVISVDTGHHRLWLSLPFLFLNFSLLLSTFMELIKYPHPVSGIKELKEEFKWSPAITRLSGFFYLRSERWKFCSWSPCVSRRVHSRWVPQVLIYTINDVLRKSWISHILLAK